MSEWGLLLATFWTFWMLDGVRWSRRSSWSVSADLRTLRARMVFGRWHWPSPWPAGWRTSVPEIPFSLSPEGICNRPAGSAGRPVEAPSIASALRWEDVRTVADNGGWLHINGHRFCPDTGHLLPRDILALAALPERERTKALETYANRWFRPANLRRRSRVLRHHTKLIVAANLFALSLGVLTTLILIAGPAGWLSETTLSKLGVWLPLLVAGMAFCHLVAIALTRVALHRCRPARPQSPDTRLISAALFPPQALRLRALVSDRFFPSQHPLAFALAFLPPKTQAQVAFDVLADLRWPAGTERDPPGAQAIAGWWRQHLERAVRRQLALLGLNAEALLAPPEPSSADACLYCPRCRDQFVAGPARCIHGISLVPLTADTPAATGQRP